MSDVDRRHGLLELDRRRVNKPYEALERDGVFPAERVVFRDTGTGAEVWRMTHDPLTSRHVYYDIPAWNVDGSLLFFIAHRPGNGSRNWLMDADGGNVRELPMPATAGEVKRPIWSTSDPATMLCAVVHDGRSELRALNVHTGETELLAEVDLVHFLEMTPPSQDGKKLLVRGRRDPDKKVWTVYLIDVATGEKTLVPIEGNIHRLRFTRADDDSIFFNLNDPVAETRTGSYRINADGTGLLELKSGGGGHPDWAPDGRAWTYTAERAIWMMDADGSNLRQLIYLGAGMHGGWSADGEWIVFDAPDLGCFANQIAMVHADEPGRVSRLCFHNASYQGWRLGHPDAESTHPAPIASPDGTKVVFDSDMLGGWGQMYVVIARRPDAPRKLEATRKGDAVSLKWTRPARDQERKGYLVYRGNAPGGPYRAVSDGLVTGETFEDRVGGDAPCFYRVAAIEHSGLEGLPSGEARAGEGEWVETVRLSIEWRLGSRDGLNDAFDGAASDFHCLELKDLEASGCAEVEFGLPKAGDYLLWARVASRDGRPAAFRVSCDDAPRQVGVCEAVTEDWLWVRALDGVGRPVRLSLEAGRHKLALETTNHSARLDRLLITDDLWRPPDDAHGFLREAPAPVTGVEVTTVDTATLKVTWDRAADAGVQYYNVYASQDPLLECEPRNRVASPLEPEWIDWGLPSATPHWTPTEYYYRVTAVDHGGNESAPSLAVMGRTGALRPG